MFSEDFTEVDGFLRGDKILKTGPTLFIDDEEPQ